MPTLPAVVIVEQRINAIILSDEGRDVHRGNIHIIEVVAVVREDTARLVRRSGRLIVRIEHGKRQLHGIGAPGNGSGAGPLQREPHDIAPLVEILL